MITNLPTRATSPLVDEFLSKQKFVISDSLTLALIESLLTKILYTLGHNKLLDRITSCTNFGSFKLVLYRDLLNRIRYILVLNMQDGPLTVFWDGTMAQKKSKKASIKVDQENLDYTHSLEKFVQYEHKVIDTLEVINTFCEKLKSTDDDDNKREAQDA